MLLNFVNFHNSMHVKRQVFQLFQNLKINVTQHFFIFTISSIEHQTLGKNWRRGQFFNVRNPLMRWRVGYVCKWGREETLSDHHGTFYLTTTRG